MSDDFNLATATKPELKYYAGTIGLKLSNAMSETTMRERIQAYCEDNGIDGPEASIEGDHRAKKQERVMINIAKQDKPGGGEPVFVGVQGVGYTIPRGINIKVPASVVEVLKNAKQDRVYQDEDGELQSEEVLTYPFQVIAA